MPEILIKKTHPDAKLPSQVHAGDAGFDVTAVGFVFDEKSNFIEYDLGFQMEIPRGYKAVIVPRSSVTATNWIIPNSPCQIDFTHRGNVKVRFKNIYERVIPHYTIPPFLEGDRIAQMFIEKIIEPTFTEVSELTPSIRNDGGFGSTGK
jgi:dUTP pyrophosphatase